MSFLSMRPRLLLVSRLILQVLLEPVVRKCASKRVSMVSLFFRLCPSSLEVQSTCVQIGRQLLRRQVLSHPSRHFIYGPILIILILRRLESRPSLQRRKVGHDRVELSRWSREPVRPAVPVTGRPGRAGELDRGQRLEASRGIDLCRGQERQSLLHEGTVAVVQLQDPGRRRAGQQGAGHRDAQHPGRLRGRGPGPGPGQSGRARDRGRRLGGPAQSGRVPDRAVLPRGPDGRGRGDGHHRGAQSARETLPRALQPLAHGEPAVPHGTLRLRQALRPGRRHVPGDEPARQRPDLRWAAAVAADRHQPGVLVRLDGHHLGAGRHAACLLQRRQAEVRRGLPAGAGPGRARHMQHRALPHRRGDLRQRGNIKTISAGDTRIERFGATNVDEDTKKLLSPFNAQLFW